MKNNQRKDFCTCSGHHNTRELRDNWCSKCEKPMKVKLLLKNVIGGLEKKEGNYVQGEEHNQLCNREVKVDEEALAYFLYKQDASYIIQEEEFRSDWERISEQQRSFWIKRAKELVQFISQGKLIKEV